MTPEGKHWEEAVRRLATAEQLLAAIGQEGAAGVAALRTAIEIIETHPLRKFEHDFQRWHWGGLIEGAMRIISGIEIAMYDPRTYPERYKR